VALRANILLADDHVVVRRGLRHVLDAQPDLSVIAEAGDGREAVERGLKPDVDLAILDVAMPRMTGLQAARELNHRRPDLKVLILSMHDTEQFFFEAVQAGASSYVLKSAADHDLVDACRAAMRGEPFIYPPAVQAIVRDYLDRLSRGEVEDPNPLTRRETEVIKLIAEGLSNREIAAELVISEKTVERHRENILGKLGLKNRVELARYAIRRGITQA